VVKNILPLKKNLFQIIFGRKYKVENKKKKTAMPPVVPVLGGHNEF
jgi:hypothetical protein